MNDTHDIDQCHLTRREWLGAAVAFTAAAAVSSNSLAGDVSMPAVGAPPKRVLRLAHLTDIHVQPERRAEEGFIACLQHVQTLDDPPSLILTGGDSVMDVMSKDVERAAAQSTIWQRVIRNECSLPVRSCIGNHDVWGWNRHGSRTSGNEPTWGKRWGEDLLGLSNRYYHFDEAGWRFIVLDSTHSEDNSYTAKLDEEQFDWLNRTLTDTPATIPILVLSHIPIVSAAAYFDGKNEETTDWKVPGSYMHIDARRIKDLFFKHSNVRLCLSGHLHLIDQVIYNDVTYCCNGAVCGAWWKGRNQECPEGYGIVDLFNDGTFANQYVPFGWQASS